MYVSHTRVAWRNLRQMCVESFMAMNHIRCICASLLYPPLQFTKRADAFHYAVRLKMNVQHRIANKCAPPLTSP